MTYKGTKILKFQADPGTHTVIVSGGGWSSGSTITGELEGHTVTDPLSSATGAPEKEGYSCSATTLTWTAAGKVIDTEQRVSDQP